MCSKEMARLAFFFIICISRTSAVRAIRQAVRWYEEPSPLSPNSVSSSESAACDGCSFGREIPIPFSLNIVSTSEITAGDSMK